MACGKKCCIFQGDLDVDKVYVWFAAVGEDAIHHRKEDRGVSNRSRVCNFICSRIVKDRI